MGQPKLSPEPGRRNNIFFTWVVFVFMVGHSGWMSKHFSLQSLLGRKGHCIVPGTDDGETCFSQSLEFTGTNACSSLCPAMPFASVAWTVGGPVSLMGRRLIPLLHGAGYCCLWPRELSTIPGLSWPWSILLSCKSNPSHGGEQQKHVAHGFESTTRDSCMCCREMSLRWQQPRL